MIFWSVSLDNGKNSFLREKGEKNGLFQGGGRTLYELLISWRGAGYMYSIKFSTALLQQIERWKLRSKAQSRMTWHGSKAWVLKNVLHRPGTSIHGLLKNKILRANTAGQAYQVEIHFAVIKFFNFFCSVVSQHALRSWQPTLPLKMREFRKS